jgi:hypothetical protein
MRFRGNVGEFSSRFAEAQEEIKFERMAEERSGGKQVVLRGKRRKEDALV